LGFLFSAPICAFSLQLHWVSRSQEIFGIHAEKGQGQLIVAVPHPLDSLCTWCMHCHSKKAAYANNIQ